jgi:hypothetical protein
VSNYGGVLLELKEVLNEDKDEGNVFEDYESKIQFLVHQDLCWVIEILVDNYGHEY